MIEILVTAVILAIGISGMGVLLLKSVQSSQDNSQKSQGMWIVQDFVGRMRANSEGARAKDYESAGAVDCSDAVTMCADYNNGNRMPSATCNSQEMATYDRWISVCGIDKSDVEDEDNLFFSSPSDFILNPILTVTCTNTSTRVSTYTGLPDCVQYFIELEWDTKLQQGAPDEDDRTYKSQYSMVVELN